MIKAERFFLKWGHLLSAFFILIVYLYLGVIFMTLGLDAIVSTICTNVILSIFGFIYIRVFFHPVKRPVTSGYAGVTLCFLIVMWLFSQITATWILSFVEDTGYVTYQEAIGTDAIAYMFLSLIFAPVAEELLFRGIFYNAIKQVAPVWLAYIFSSLGFAIMHGTIVHMIVGFTCGMFLVMAYERTGNIIWCMILHSIYNFMSLFMTGVAYPNLFFQPVVFLTADLLIVIALCMEGCRIHRLQFSSNVLRTSVVQTMPNFSTSDAMSESDVIQEKNDV